MGNLRTTSDPVKMLLIGDSGSAKTGALWSLARAGYTVVIADFDSGLDILKVLGRTEPKVADNIYSEQFQDKFTTTGAFGVDGVPNAFMNLGSWMNHCKGEGYDLGPVNSWGTDKVFVIDSLTHMGNAAMRYVMALSGHLNKHASLPDWGAAQDKIENFLGEINSIRVKCNVIVTAHIDYIVFKETGIVRGLPMAPGQKLSPKIPTYFNTAVIAKGGYKPDPIKNPSGRRLRLVSDGLIEAKVPATNLPEDLPIETGLNTIFNAIRGTNK